MTAKRDKGYLRELSRLVLTELQRNKLPAPFRLKHRLKSRKTNTDGWAVTLGTFTGYRCRAEIWLDRFTAHTDRKVCYCLYSFQRDGLAKLAHAAAPEFGKHLSIYLKDWDDDTDFSCLSKKLAKARFGHPIYERYPSNREFFYGVFEHDKTGLQRNVIARLARRTSAFFQTITEAVSDNHSPANSDIYPRVENRQKVMKHLRRERSSHAANLCKDRDNYICQICKFDYSMAYGTLGNDFAEAHHIVPLSSNKKIRNTTIDDLITVCSNCHRMLHRMDGMSKDIDQLKKIVKLHKKR